MKRKSCEGCSHYKPLLETNRTNYGCHYILDTGKSRGCPVDNCVHHTKRFQKESMNR